MLELERYSLSQLRGELRSTADEAERLERALAGLEMLIPAEPKPSPMPTKPAAPTPVSAGLKRRRYA